MHWAGFLLCSALIIYSGIRLSRYGDIIAEKSGLGRTWVGVVLVATVTSLPELVSSISGVAMNDAPDIAVGNLVGACSVNLLIFGLLDAVHRSGPLSARARQGHILSAGVGIVMMCGVVSGIQLRDSVVPLGWIGPYSLVFLLGYLIAMRVIYFYEQKNLRNYMEEVAERSPFAGIPLKQALARFGINAAVVVGAAFFLPGIGVGLAEQTGLGQTFVGTLFIAVATTLPEIVVSVSAVRMGAVDLAIGNLFGSNLFNIAILGIADLFFPKGPLLSMVSSSHSVMGHAAIAMSGLAIVGLTYRAERKKLFLAWDAICIVLVYCVSVMLLYSLH